MTDPQSTVLCRQAAQKVLATANATTRRMFELADAMRRDGNGPVYDLSLGNPSLEPPDCWFEALSTLVAERATGRHRYMVNSGFTEVREFIAAREARRYGVEFGADDVTMTCGAAGALNVVLRCVIDPGEEVLVPRPYFTEYGNYCDNVGAVLRSVAPGEGFALDPDAVLAAVGDSTRVIVLNSPNNPTGAIYDDASLRRLAEGLRRRQQAGGRPIVVIEDSPYRDLVFDGSDVPSILPHYPNTVFLSSHSKDLGLAGERIGYALLSPNFEGLEHMRAAMGYYNRTLGFVNAPALMQRALPMVLDRPDGRVDVSIYAENCRRMAAALSELGFGLEPPRAGFFLFPRLPEAMLAQGEGADGRFSELAAKHRVILVPGSAFGSPGYLRISMCIAPDQVDGAIAALRAACAELD